MFNLLYRYMDHNGDIILFLALYIKRLLEARRSKIEGNRNYAERDREFIGMVWYKLGRDSDEAFKKA